MLRPARPMPSAVRAGVLVAGVVSAVLAVGFVSYSSVLVLSASIAVWFLAVDRRTRPRPAV